MPLKTSLRERLTKSLLLRSENAKTVQTMGMMIIKTKKMSPRDVKKKLHEFIDNISEDCGPEIEKMADELKEHGDMFIDELSGYGSDGAGYNRNDNGMSGGYNRDGMGYDRSGYMRGRAWHRNEGSWEQREELRKRNEQKLQEMDRMMQEMRQQLMSDM